MANTRARSYNTLTYNGGKHMLNSKIAMRKRLLNKYKQDQQPTPNKDLYNNNNDDTKEQQQHKVCDGKKEVENTSVNLTSTEHRVTARPGSEAKKEEMDCELIDVETVTDPTDVNTKPYSSPAEVSSSDWTSVVSSAKPSLEDVIARCRLKSSEWEQQIKKSEESPDSIGCNKTALESLKAVVNSVTPSENCDLSSSLSQGEESGSDCSQSPSSSSSSSSTTKRYLSPYAKTILNEWFRKHLFRPYPTYEEKKELAKLCGISPSKVDTWFANKRNRTHNTKKLPPKYSHLLAGALSPSSYSD